MSEKLLNAVKQHKNSFLKVHWPKAHFWTSCLFQLMYDILIG